MPVLPTSGLEDCLRKIGAKNRLITAEAVTQKRARRRADAGAQWIASTELVTQRAADDAAGQATGRRTAGRIISDRRRWRRRLINHRRRRLIDHGRRWRIITHLRLRIIIIYLRAGIAMMAVMVMMVMMSPAMTTMVAPTVSPIIVIGKSG